MSLRATDDVGNVTVRASERALIDGIGPLADLTFSGPSPQTLDGVGDKRPVISGTVADVPYPSNALLHLHFEEPSFAPAYADGTSLRHVGTCDSACEQAAGVLGRAVMLNNTDALTVSDPLRAGAPITLGGYTLGLWVKPQSAQSLSLIHI